MNKFIVWLRRYAITVTLSMAVQGCATQETIPEDDKLPDFFVFAEGVNGEISVKVTLSRIDGDVRGVGRLVRNGGRTLFRVNDATLCTDPSIKQNAILQTDSDQPFGVWTPACVELNVRLLRFPFPRRKLLLSECEPRNEEICDLGGVETDPRGSCVQSDRDTVKWEEEFVVPGETAIIAPEFQSICPKRNQAWRKNANEEPIASHTTR